MDVEDLSGGEMSTTSGTESDNSEENTFEIGAQRPQIAICIMADSGATVNILSKKDFDSLKLKYHG